MTGSRVDELSRGSLPPAVVSDERTLPSRAALCGHPGRGWSGQDTRPPVRMGGLGIRSARDLAAPRVLSSLHAVKQIYTVICLITPRPLTLRR